MQLHDCEVSSLKQQVADQALLIEELRASLANVATFRQREDGSPPHASSPSRPSSAGVYHAHVVGIDMETADSTFEDQVEACLKSRDSVQSRRPHSAQLKRPSARSTSGTPWMRDLCIEALKANNLKETKVGSNVTEAPSACSTRPPTASTCRGSSSRPGSRPQTAGRIRSTQALLHTRAIEGHTRYLANLRAQFYGVTGTEQDRDPVRIWRNMRETIYRDRDIREDRLRNLVMRPRYVGEPPPRFVEFEELHYHSYDERTYG